jgi:DNA-binding NtrC family response regulator
MQSILAVDDERHMLALLERIVQEKTPYRITTESNSLKVPLILKDEGFDLIITDLKMPGLDGMDIVKMIREKNRFEVVVIITAFGSLETATEALSFGAFDYITKPFKSEQISGTIERAMRWQRMRREMERLGEIFDREPYTDAQAAFHREYLQRLAERVGGDAASMAQRSGLSPDVIQSAMSDKD